MFFKLREKYYPAALKNQSSADIWHRYDPILDRSRIDKMFDRIKNASVVESDVLILSKPPKDVLYSELSKSQQRNGILSALKNAKKSIKILGANLNGKEVSDAILNAIKRGVKVEILLPSSMLDELSSLDAKSNHQTYYYLSKKAKELNVKKI
ncbi:phospholipase D-like domain-containing protein [Vibrio pectenicida]|uniref:phospholipase D-like domain-containing protein n=1 Tax=Vibrio pectenicida TaxID=62763 RepID=UPI003B9CA484